MNLSEMMRETTNRIIRSATFKLLTICILILILLIPASMVERLIREREARRQAAISDITDKWGRAQTLIGPVLSVPYKVFYENRDGFRAESTRTLHILPDALDVTCRIDPQIRYRGIYEAVVYNAAMQLSGRFLRPASAQLPVPPDQIMWPEATISIGITDMRGIREGVQAQFDEKAVVLNSGITVHDIFPAGISSPVTLDDTSQEFAFTFLLNLNGSHQLRFAPVGKFTTVAAHSDWQDPSFDGAFLPVERSVTAEGFSAKWKVLHLNRNYPQIWTGNTQSLDGSYFGVTLFNPVNVYQKSTRTAKYALLFIVVAFMAFFISEFLNHLRVHPVQYFLIGLGIVVFYSLLLSFSEHLGFAWAYFISALAIVALITTYARSILGSSKLALTAGASLAGLYVYLYVLLHLVDFALLMGSVGLFGLLAAVMYLTRHIDWYQFGPGTEKRAGAHTSGDPVALQNEL